MDNDRTKTVDPAIVRAVIYSLEASLCSLLAYVLNSRYLLASESPSAVRVTLLVAFFHWLAYFFCALVNLIPAFAIRFFIFDRPPEGRQLQAATFVNYGTVMALMQIPLGLFTGTTQVGSGLFFFLSSRLAGLGCALLMLLGGRSVLMIPEKEEDPLLVYDDSSLCLSELGSFISLARGSLGQGVSREALWQPVYAYLKDEELMENLVQGRHLAHDEIVLNAIGSVAYRMLASGDFHAGPGELSEQGQFVYAIWKLAAEELVRRMYNTREDATRGFETLNAAIYSANWEE